MVDQDLLVAAEALGATCSPMAIYSSPGCAYCSKVDAGGLV